MKTKRSKEVSIVQDRTKTSEKKPKIKRIQERSKDSVTIQDRAKTSKKIPKIKEIQERSTDNTTIHDRKKTSKTIQKVKEKQERSTGGQYNHPRSEENFEVNTEEQVKKRTIEEENGNHPGSEEYFGSNTEYPRVEQRVREEDNTIEEEFKSPITGRRIHEEFEGPRLGPRVEEEEDKRSEKERKVVNKEESRQKPSSNEERGIQETVLTVEEEDERRGPNNNGTNNEPNEQGPNVGKRRRENKATEIQEPRIKQEEINITNVVEEEDTPKEGEDKEEPVKRRFAKKQKKNRTASPVPEYPESEGEYEGSNYSEEDECSTASARDAWYEYKQESEVAERDLENENNVVEEASWERAREDSRILRAGSQRAVIRLIQTSLDNKRQRIERLSEIRRKEKNQYYQNQRYIAGTLRLRGNRESNSARNLQGFQHELLDLRDQLNSVLRRIDEIEKEATANENE